MIRVHSGLMLGIAFSLDSLRTDTETVWQTQGGRLREDGSEALFCDMTGQPYQPVEKHDWIRNIHDLAQSLDMSPDSVIEELLHDGDAPIVGGLIDGTRPLNIMPGVARGELTRGAPEMATRTIFGMVVARLDDFDADFSSACEGIDLNDIAGHCSRISSYAALLGITGPVKLYPYLYMGGMDVTSSSELEDGDHDPSCGTERENQTIDDSEGPHENCPSCPDKADCSDYRAWADAL